VSTTPFFQPILSIAQVPDVWDVVERNAHGNVQLGGGHVDPGDGFSHRVFHLETWVQLQEAKGVGLGELCNGTLGWLMLSDIDDPSREKSKGKVKQTTLNSN